MNDFWPWIMLAALGIYHGINPGMGWLFAVSLGLQESSRKAVVKAFTPIALGHFVSIAVVAAAAALMQQAVPREVLKYGGSLALIGFGIYKFLAPMSHPRWVGMRVGPGQLALWSFLMATAHGAGLMVAPVVLQMGEARTRLADAPIHLPSGGSHVFPAAWEPGAAGLTPAALTESTAGPAASRPAEPPACHPESGKPVAGVSGSADAEQEPACHREIGAMASGAGGAILALGGAGLHTLTMFLTMAAVALLVYDRIGLRILRTAWYNLDLIWVAALIGGGVLMLLAG